MKPYPLHMEPKYKLQEVLHSQFSRIVACRAFGDVLEGDLGGYIEREENLSHDGNCWVYDEAWVTGAARVVHDAQVRDIARVFGNAIIYGHAKILQESTVSGNARVSGYARIFGQVHLRGSVHVHGGMEGGFVSNGAAII